MSTDGQTVTSAGSIRLNPNKPYGKTIGTAVPSQDDQIKRGRPISWVTVAVCESSVRGARPEFNATGLFAALDAQSDHSRHRL